MRQRDFVTLLSDATAWVAVPQHQTPRRDTLQHGPASAAVTTHRLGQSL
jgi:hypothetical protein